MSDKYFKDHITITPKDKSDPSAEAYLKHMVSTLKDIKREIKPASKIQAESLQATLNRDPSLDEKHFFRSIDLSKAITLHPELVARSISIEEFNIFKQMRQSSKNTIGQFEGSSPSEERKQKAALAFQFTPPIELTEVEIEKLTRLQPIKELKELKYEWKPMTSWQAFKHWLKGGRIRKINEDKK